MRWISTVTAAALVATAATLAVPATPAAAAAETAVIDGPKVTWNASAWGKARGFTAGLDAWAAAVKERTGGKFTINVHYGETLSKSKENLDGIKIGAFQAAMVCVSYHPAKTPALGVLDLPMLPYKDDTAQIATFKAVYSHPYIRDELARWNAYPAFALLSTNYMLLGRGNPPNRIADWTGLRVRAPGGMGEAMKRLGAVPTSVPAPETYTAIERGTIDAAGQGPSTHIALSIHEVSDWYTGNLPVGTINCPVVVNTKALADLPPAYRDLLLGEAADIGYAVQVKTYQDDNERVRKILTDKGLTEVRYTDGDIERFVEAAALPVWKAWVDEQKAAGAPAQELLDLVLKTARGR